MSTTAVHTPAEYESRLRDYYYERAEEGRAVRVGEKEVSEQAAIVARYDDLFSRAQLESLHEAENGAEGDDHERLYRLRKTCEGGIICAELADKMDALENALVAASDATTELYAVMRERWFDRILGPRRDAIPTSGHVAYVRRLSPLESTYTKDRATAICLETTSALGFDLTSIPNIHLDLEDRPQKNPRACVIASDPPNVVHLITLAQGGLADYQAFMHEAGHALHYAGVDPRLPFTFRAISRDHAPTELYSYIFEAITREPGWHAPHFGLSDAQAKENAEATVFLEALLYRRYTAKLRYELGFWTAFADERGNSERDYATLLTEATGIRYDPRGYLSDMDSGFYSADYLRAWIRSAQLRAFLLGEVGPDWWRSAKTGEILRDLFAEGTKPTSEEIATRLGFDALDTGPL